MSGKLTIVALPIGNNGDLAPRALETLAAADAVLAEDTRRAGRLLKEHNIQADLLSFFEHNEEGRLPQALERLKNGEHFALISDAGTPAISDPGYRIVRACREEGISVSTVPGACAAIAALSISGLPSDRFTFEGFLPPKGAKREKRVQAILESNCTSIIYESTHKIEKLLSAIAGIDPEREIFVARELTKTYEECLRGSASEIEAEVSKRKGLKGEIVVIVSRSVV